MSRLEALLILIIFSLILVGCQSSGISSVAKTDENSSSVLADKLSSSDLMGVEAGLLASRLLAADSAPTVSASLLAEPTASFSQGMEPLGSFTNLVPPASFPPFLAG
ncbi:MAG: hypothetical protein HQM08_30675, partial [Candidatus Riflebacteria bacterium]|nr:hypothetical protein [Candidatus Riflebacteria bacterium]